MQKQIERGNLVRTLEKFRTLHQLANTAAIQQDVIEGEINSSSAAFLDIALLCIDGVDFAAAEISLHESR
jgi:hypothetical protein